MTTCFNSSRITLCLAWGCASGGSFLLVPDPHVLVPTPCPSPRGDLLLLVTLICWLREEGFRGGGPTPLGFLPLGCPAAWLSDA